MREREGGVAGQVAPDPFACACAAQGAMRPDILLLSACRGSQHAIEGVWMSKSLARLCSALSLCLIALLLSGGIVHAQRSGEAGAAVYRIDPQKSDIHLLVFRDGALSTFGHNHVVSLNDFKGTIYLQPKLEQSRVELEIPVDRLIVDDAALRRLEGEGFANQPSKDDVAGTRTNMLSEPLLNAKQFSTIKVTGTSGPVDAKNSAMLNLSVQIVGREIKLTLPCTLKLEGDQLEAAWEAELSHKQLGLKPFGALLGSLRVAEQMKFKYRIRASKEPK
jgi:polyisoprenoid-binding protein YceI